jgi:hypothetical protein
MLFSSEPALKIEIFSLNGSKLMETNESQISVARLENGCYIARLQTSGGIYNQLVEKNRP